MTDQLLPPLRTSHSWPAPGGLWGYDMWGRHGRPVVFVPPIMFDRAMWWPAAADLRPHATVIAVDLPGHGTSAARDRYDPEELVDDLAQLIRGVGATRAPVLVGHASSAALALLFAARYATHAVVTVDDLDDRPPSDVPRYLADMRLDALSEPYQDMIVPVREARLLRAYADCLHRNRPATTAARTARLAIYSTAPPETPAAPWRHEIYAVAGRFAHVTAVSRFVADVRTSL